MDVVLRCFEILTGMVQKALTALDRQIILRGMLLAEIHSRNTSPEIRVPIKHV